MYFTIKVYYSTGDSFGNYDTDDTIGHCWKNKELAELVSTYIDEHHDAYKKFNQTIFNSHDSLIESIKNKPWYNGIYWENSLKIPTDDGGTSTINTFWCGYFETLMSTEIEEEKAP